MSENHVCRVCGTTYPPSQTSCPRCGALPGTARPAYLRCRQCGAVFPSSCTLCTACRQVVSPRTASVVLLSDVPQTLRPQHPVQPVVQPAPRPVQQRPVQQRPAAPRPAAAPRKNSSHIRRLLIIAGIAVAFVLSVVVESIVVRRAYAGGAYAECMTLWNNGGPISDNRRVATPSHRAPKPEPKPEQEAPRDTTPFDDPATDPGHSETVLDEEMDETAPGRSPHNNHSGQKDRNDRNDRSARSEQKPVKNEPDPFE